MKLVEILARELDSWPEGCDGIYQDYDQELRFRGCDRTRSNKYPGELASDFVRARGVIGYSGGVVTREMWQAERERIAKPGKKANAEGWVRHRGGKCPVEAGVIVEVRLRDGKEWTGEEAEKGDFWVWRHSGDSGDIMAYRIHNPAEQPERAAIVEQMQEQCAALAESANSLKQDGPIQWRDRIREIDRTVEALEEERVSLIQRIEDEGFKLIDQVNAKIAEAAQAHEDASDWRDWEEGDLIESIGKSGGYSPGSIYAISGLDRSRKVVFTVLDDNGSKTNGWHVKFFKFHSRPSA